MNTCQLERIEETINFTFFHLQNSSIPEIKDFWCGISAFYPQTVMIRAIYPQQWRQIAENPLTERELEVLKMIVDGHSNVGIAQELFITVGTVKTHVRNILCKLDVSDRTQASVLALRSGLVN